MFQYDAKWKDELEYWDRYPLVMPISYEKGYMTGLNFHYIPPFLRAKLLDEIVDNNARHRFYENRRIRFNFDILQRAARNPLYIPCVKKYIISPKHVKSKFLIIPPDEYTFALFLPFDMFQKKSKEFVWAESVKKIRAAGGR